MRGAMMMVWERPRTASRTLRRILWGVEFSVTRRRRIKAGVLRVKPMMARAVGE